MTLVNVCECQLCFLGIVLSSCSMMYVASYTVRELFETAHVMSYFCRYVYQKAYVEFFVSPEKFEELEQRLQKQSSITYMAIDSKSKVCNTPSEAGQLRQRGSVACIQMTLFHCGSCEGSCSSLVVNSAVASACSVHFTMHQDAATSSPLCWLSLIFTVCAHICLCTQHRVRHSATSCGTAQSEEQQRGDGAGS